MAQLTTSLVNGDLRVTGNIYGNYTHTHTTNIASDTSSGTVVSLAANTQYKLTAGGTSVLFKTPSDEKVKRTPLTTSQNGDFPILCAGVRETSETTGTANATGSLLTFNPSTLTLTTSVFSGNLSGNATTATTANNYNTSTGTIKTALDGKVNTSTGVTIGDSIITSSSSTGNWYKAITIEANGTGGNKTLATYLLIGLSHYNNTSDAFMLADVNVRVGSNNTLGVKFFDIYSMSRPVNTAVFNMCLIGRFDTTANKGYVDIYVYISGDYHLAKISVLNAMNGYGTDKSSYSFYSYNTSGGSATKPTAPSGGLLADVNFHTHITSPTVHQLVVGELGTDPNTIYFT